MTHLTLLQNEQEIAEFTLLLMQENVRSYLEIGSKFGGSLEKVGQILPKGSRAVAVDLPHGTGAWPQTRISLQKVIDNLQEREIDARVIWGDSTHPDVVAKVTELAPFDCVLIDANHTMSYVTRDFDNYAPLSRIVAFHDISFYRDPAVMKNRSPIDVPIFWEAIKHRYRFREIKREADNNGLGIIWRE